MSDARKAVEVAVAVVFDGARQRVLICKRKADAVLGGFWELPGGKCAGGETLVECARREVREEVGIEVEAVSRLGSIEHAYPHALVRLTPFVCRHVAGAVALLAVAEARWVLPGEVAAYRFPPANEGLMRDVAQGWRHLLAMSRGDDRKAGGT